MSDRLLNSPYRPVRVVAPSITGPPVIGTLAVVIVCIGALYIGRDVFIPLVMAVLLSFVLAPVVSLFRRWHVPRLPAIIVTVVLALGVILAVGGVIGLQIADLGSNLPRYQETMQTKLVNLQSGVFGRFSALIHKASEAVQSNNTNPGAVPASAIKPGSTKPEDKPLLVRLPEQEISLIAVARTVLGPVISPLTTSGIVIVVVIFLLLQREDLRDRMIRLLGSNDLHRTTMAMDDAAKRLSTYFLTQLGINAAFGFIVALALWWIGLPSPVLWGVLAAMMRFVPYIGSAISALLPTVLAAAVMPGWQLVWSTAALFIVTETIMAQAVEPLLYGHSTGLSPFAVIVSALFWAWLWGPIGLILSTPFTVILVVLGRHVEHLEFLDVLFGDSPALTPVENFYQRILAGDPDEARDQAEKLLKDCPLISYYDDVALKGLQLAAADVQRGVLSLEKLELMKLSVQELVTDLGRSAEEAARRRPPSAGVKNEGEPIEGPGPTERTLPRMAGPSAHFDASSLSQEWQCNGAILCVAGRGPLDEAAVTILAQLLRQNGFGVQVSSHEQVSRRNIETFDFPDVMMVCMVYLEIAGSPSHLRYLIQRLRARLPLQKLLVGLWADDDPVFGDPKLRTETGADIYVSSLRDAVSTCIDQASVPASNIIVA
jgi:predicted PurR-regulated permease PerM